MRGQPALSALAKEKGLEGIIAKRKTSTYRPGRRLRTEIFAYIQGKVGNAATAEDLTQETFVKVGRALAKGTTPEHFRGWLYQIARNTIIDSFEESRRFVPLEESVVDREV
jgi:RNA polymerase sigma factor (sigma-70 family)